MTTYDEERLGVIFLSLVWSSLSEEYYFVLFFKLGYIWVRFRYDGKVSRTNRLIKMLIAVLVRRAPREVLLEVQAARSLRGASTAQYICLWNRVLLSATLMLFFAFSLSLPLSRSYLRSIIYNRRALALDMMRDTCKHHTSLGNFISHENKNFKTNNNIESTVIHSPRLSNVPLNPHELITINFASNYLNPL